MTSEALTTKDHRIDHPGCNAVFPWMRSCKRWKNPDLLKRAAAEVVGMKPGYGDWWLEHMRMSSDFYRLRNNRRDSFIYNLEGYDHQDLDILVKGVEATGTRNGLGEIEIAHEAAISWNELRQRLAMGVLFAYGEIA